MAVEMWNANPDWDKNGDGVINYVMLTGDAENPEAIARTEYSISTVEEAGIETKELGQQVANWNADQAYTAVSAWISREGDNIEMIFANNDSMASGAISALQSAGYNNGEDRKSTRLNSSHVSISYAVFCLKKKKRKTDSR